MLSSTCIKLYRGQVKTQYGYRTAINKHLVEQDIELSPLGLTSNECADLKHHGGIDRALHQYPQEHYAYWHQRYPGSEKKWQAAGMGENISSLGMTEDNVYIGDQYQLGSSVIEVSQPRSPCFKLNNQWGVEDISLAMQNSGRCGWLYRVIQPGLINEGAQLTLLKRVKGSLSIQEVCHLFFHQPLEKQGLEQLIALESLSQGWRDTASRRLTTGEIENWQTRLFGVS